MPSPARAIALLVPAALAASLLTGCGDEAADLPPPPASAPAGGTAPGSTVDPEHGPILAAYEGYIRASNEAANLGDPDHPDLKVYADAGALAQARAAIRQHADNGRVYRGARVIRSAEVSEVDLDAPFPEPNATIVGCMDISDYVLVLAEDQSPLPVERDLEQVMATASLWYTPDQRWVVIDADALWDTPC